MYDAIVFYVGALVLYGLGAILIRHTSPFTKSRGKYERKKKRRILGEILLITATLSLGIGALVQFISSNP